MSDEFWRDHAACLGRVSAERDAWYPESGQHVASYRGGKVRIAFAVCASCPVQRPCLADALAAEHGWSLQRRHGVFAGTTPMDRYVLDGGEPEPPRVPRPRGARHATRRVAPALCQTP